MMQQENTQMNPGMPGRNPGAPGMNPGMPGGNPGMPGGPPGAPGMNPGMPGMNPGAPGMNPGMPGGTPGAPGVNQRMPGMNPGMPGGPPGAPGVNQRMPGMNPGMPGRNPGMRGMNPGMPGRNPGMPGMNPGAPRVNNRAPRPVSTMAKQYPYFGILSLIYAALCALFLYRNASGITFPLFTAATMIYFYLCFRKLNIPWKKSSICYVVGIELLGISTCLTANGAILMVNKLGMFLLLICFLLHSVYDDRSWDLLKYFSAFFEAIVMAFSCVARPVTDWIQHSQLMREQYGKQSKRSKAGLYVVVGLAIGIPLALFMLILLASADAVFGGWISRIFDVPFWTLFQHLFLIVVLMVVAFFGSYMLTAYMNERGIRMEAVSSKKAEPTAAITVAAVLSFVYVIFCAVQIAYLFVGGATGALSLPDGMTYAEYARTGFFQLLFVSVCNLLLVVVGIRCFHSHIALKILLCVITACTYIMIASSALRMVMYIQYKYLTNLRIMVLWACFVLLLLVTGVMITIFRQGFPLFRFGVIAVSVCYIVLSFARTDYWIAKVNIDNMHEETQYAFFSGSPVYDDTSYLARDLSMDAAPAIITPEARADYEWLEMNARIEDTSVKSYYLWADTSELEGEAWRCRYIIEQQEDYQKISWRTFNWSRFRFEQMMRR
ncbi:MAG: DUF4173 domain-containing protein [Lachnospiraceae bacterium]|nr:DUF4173 domain-containing protein [Lachnospiraceae bacterium]